MAQVMETRGANRPLERLQQAAGLCEVLVDEKDLGWVRARELVVGLVRTPVELWRRQVSSACEALDCLPAGKSVIGDERWCVLLFVNLVGDAEEHSGVGRMVAADFDGPEKVVLWNDDRIPPIFSLPTSADSGAQPDLSAVERGLDAAAGPNIELRATLEVLLKGRITDDEVEQLIERLAGERGAHERA